MFKTVFANRNYSVSLEGIVQNKATYERLPVIDGKVFIDLYDVPQNVDLVWLSLMSHFEVSLRSMTKEDISLIYFDKFNDVKLLKLNCEYCMCFKEPIYFNTQKYASKYRVIPNFTRYAVDKDGEVIDTHLDEILEHRIYEYPSVWIYDPDKNRYRSIKIHRLLAMAWIEGMGVNNAFVVNHIDGNKLNFSLDNLEWVTVSENNKHAFLNGLRTDNINCVVRVIKTNEIHEFCSVSDACLFMGLNGCQNLTSLKHNKCSALIKKGFEFRTKDDMYPWVVTDSFKSDRLGKLHIKVVYPDGSVEEFGTNLDFKRRFKLWNLEFNNISALVSELKKRRGDLIITYEDSRINESYQALRLSDMQVFESESIRDLSRLINVPFSNIQYSINKYPYGAHISGDYIFRIKSDKPFELHKASVRYNRNKEITARNVINGELISFSSLRECAKHFNVDRGVIKARLYDRSRLGDMEFILNDSF